MPVGEQTEVLRFFAVDLACYASYEEVRLVVERSDPVPLRVPELPYEPPALSLFATLLLDPAGLGSEHQLSIDWIGTGGDVEARHEQALLLPEDAVVSGPFPISFVVNFEGLKFTSQGACEARLSFDGQQIEALLVEVIAIPSSS